MVKRKMHKSKVIQCDICGKDKKFFYRELKKNRHFYCSPKCQAIGASKIMKEKYSNGEIDRFAATLAANKAVVIKSQNQFKINPKIYENELGYKRIYIPQNGFKSYHRYIWENEYGPIPAGFHIHHIDGNPKNNNIKNLIAMKISEHHRLHKSTIDYSEVERLNNIGLSIIEIAKELNCSRASVINWREKCQIMTR